MSKALGVQHAKLYHKKDFANNASISYYRGAHRPTLEWTGQLAAQWGLPGELKERQYHRLVEGRHPQARYDPEQLAWKEEQGQKVLAEKQSGEAVSRVWQEGQYWHRSDSSKIYSTEKSAVHDTYYQAVAQLIEPHKTATAALDKRAIIDTVFNFDKTISVTAVEDPRIYQAAYRASKAGIEAMEERAQAHKGGDHSPETTGKLIAGGFLHTTARPEKMEIEPGKVIDYNAPHCHVHWTVIGFTQDAQGEYRALEPETLYQAQRYASAIANAEIARELRAFGYQVGSGKNGATIIEGYTADYLKAESPRAERINQMAAERGSASRSSRELFAHQYRQAKTEKTEAEVQAEQRRMAERYGGQPKRIVAEAKQQTHLIDQSPLWNAERALTYAKESLSIRTDVFTQDELITRALRVSLGYVREPELRQELVRRSQTDHEFENSVPREFMQARHAEPPNTLIRSWTTTAAQEKEREAISLALDMRQQITPLAEYKTVEWIEQRFAHYNRGKGISQEQAEAVRRIITSPDGAFALVGSAGSGKTSSILAPVRELYEEAGFTVIGMGPTGRSAKELRDAGISHSMTIARFLHTNERGLQRMGIDTAKPRLYIVDEMSMVSSQTDVELLLQLKQSLPKQYRMLQVGDYFQHESVDAGRIFEEKMQAGMPFVAVTDIVRQRTEDYREVVRYMQLQKPHMAMQKLETMGCIHEQREPEGRVRAIARQFVQSPERTLVVSPFNKTRIEINEAIREELRQAGKLAPDSICQATVYVQRQDSNAKDLTRAISYQAGDVLAFDQKKQLILSNGQSISIDRQQYGEVIRRNPDPNGQWIEVRLYGDRAKTIRYNPEEYSQVSVYRREQRDWAVGDSLLFKKPYKGFENGDTFTITKTEANGNLTLQATKSRIGEEARTLVFNVKDNPHIDYAYTSTSYSSQGATVDRVIVDLPTREKGAKAAINTMLGYVSTSRGRVEIGVHTDSVQRATELLSQSGKKAIALSEESVAEYLQNKPRERESYANPTDTAWPLRATIAEQPRTRFRV